MNLLLPRRLWRQILRFKANLLASNRRFKHISARWTNKNGHAVLESRCVCLSFRVGNRGSAGEEVSRLHLERVDGVEILKNDQLGERLSAGLQADGFLRDFRP